MHGKCEHKDCKKPAQFAPQIMIQPQGWPRGTSNPLVCIISLKLCKKHMKALKVHELLTDELKELAKLAVKGKCPPDLDHAWLEPLSLDSQKYAEFERHIRKDSLQ